MRNPPQSSCYRGIGGVRIAEAQSRVNDRLKALVIAVSEGRKRRLWACACADRLKALVIAVSEGKEVMGYYLTRSHRLKALVIAVSEGMR